MSLALYSLREQDYLLSTIQHGSVKGVCGILTTHIEIFNLENLYAIWSINNGRKLNNILSLLVTIEVTMLLRTWELNTDGKFNIASMRKAICCMRQISMLIFLNNYGNKKFLKDADSSFGLSYIVA